MDSTLNMHVKTYSAHGNDLETRLYIKKKTNQLPNKQIIKKYTLREDHIFFFMTFDIQVNK